SASTEDRKAFRQSQREILDAGLTSTLTAEQLDALQTVKAERPKRAPRLRQLINRLDLSDAQKANFAAFFEAQRAQRAAWQEANPEATRADRRAYRQSQRGEMREAVETILTPAQQEQLKNARQRAKQRTERRGGSPRAEGQRSAPATTFALSNAPNPFNPTTTLRFELRTSERVVLEVYNTQGQRVATLIDGERAAGVHTARFDAADLPTGTYIARLTVGRLVESRRLSLVK
ncbi:MAG: T9SS type A sorting domain-containing protein, partial [Bacteroidota bacterium]